MANDNVFSTIRFIGYAIPTTPANLVSIGNPNGPGAVAGTNLGNTDTQQDFLDRIQILKNGVDTAKAQLPTNEEGVINLFVAPEFYFHGVKGPYVYQDAAADPVDAIRQALAEAFSADEYLTWVFAFGSVVTAQIQNLEKVLRSNAASTRNKVVQSLAEQWSKAFGPLKSVLFDMLVNFIKVCHSYPCCEVRNRSVIVSNLPLMSSTDIPFDTNAITTEKYFVSNEDLLLYDVEGADIITEQMTGYPPLDLSGGDFKLKVDDPYAIFRLPIHGQYVDMDLGVEICLDHSDTRLRRNLSTFSTIQIGGIHVQMIPSCGMQIIAPSVAADKNGFVFNCDGQYALNDEPKGSAVLNEVDCLYANYTWANEKGLKYAAHTQLARVAEKAQGENPEIPNTSATFQTLALDDIKPFPVSPPPGLGDYFAGGAGQVHIYGLQTPFTLYPETR